MEIVIVGGGTAGWITAILASYRHPNHNITVIESTKLGVIGVGESTTGRLTDLLVNFVYDLGCDHHEFLIETGSTLKYAIHHKGWTNNIDEGYIAPIDGTWTRESSPDPFACFGINRLKFKDFPLVSKIGHTILNNSSNFNKDTGNFENFSHALHIDAHLVGKYFKKISLKNKNVKHIDDQVIDVNLDSETGHIKSVKLSSGQTVTGEFFIDCSGFNKVLMKHMPTKWVSYQKNLPLNTGLPFHLDYKEDEMPEPYTTAWAQKNGWMWQIPLMDRKGCGYVYCDAYTTPDKAQEEIETILQRKINPFKTIKFDAGRQESAWVNNCLTIGLSSAFLEPLEATSIHSTIVQAQSFIFEYLKPTLEGTLNEGSRNIYNQRTRKLYDDIKDFLVLHYMGGREDSEFWKYIKTGATKTEYVHSLLEMIKSRIPSMNDFPNYNGSAGWPLYSFVMHGLHLLDKDVSAEELNMNIPNHGNLRMLTVNAFYDAQDQWNNEIKRYYSYDQFITHYRNLREQYGFSDKKD